MDFNGKLCCPPSSNCLLTIDGFPDSGIPVNNRDKYDNDDYRWISDRT